MNTYIFTSPHFQPLDLAGARMPGSYLQFFVSQTDTPADVFSDAALTSSLGPEVTADLEGVFPVIYMSPTVTYRVIFYTAEDTLEWDVDPYTPPRDYPPRTVMWFLGTAEQRDAEYPPELWQVLDGNNGTVDGRDRFPIIAGGDYVAGDTGGGGGESETGENEAIPAGETGETALDETMFPAHTHRLYCWLGVGSDGEHDATGWPGAGLAAQRGAQPSGGSFGYSNANGSATPLVEDSGGGDPEPHTHTIPEIPAHTHPLTSALPPYIALWAIMRRVP